MPCVLPLLCTLSLLRTITILQSQPYFTGLLTCATCKPSYGYRALTAPCNTPSPSGVTLTLVSGHQRSFVGVARPPAVRESHYSGCLSIFKWRSQCIIRRGGSALYAKTGAFVVHANFESSCLKYRVKRRFKSLSVGSRGTACDCVRLFHAFGIRQHIDRFKQYTCAYTADDRASH